MSGNVKGLEYKVENVGRTFKSLKKSHFWGLEIDHELLKIEFVSYKFSKTRVVLLNGAEIFKGQKGKTEFSYSFHVFLHIVTVTEGEKGIDLYVDGLSFLILHKQQAGSFLEAGETDELRSLTPVRLRESVFGLETKRKSQPWESKAKNFRLISREIPAGTVRERVPIETRSEQDESIFSLKSYVESSPTSTVISTHARGSRRMSIGPVKANSKKVKKKQINFFLQF